MAEQITPGGVILPPGFESKADRVSQATIPRNLTGVQAESKFRDYTSYLRAIKLPWVYACVSLIATAFADARYDLFDKGKVIEDANNPLLQLLARPNPYQTGFEFLERASFFMELLGEVFISLEERDGYGKPREMYLPNPARMRVVPDPERYVRGYTYEAGNYNPYSYQNQGGRFIPYDVDEIVHIRMPNPLDDYRGMGPVEASQELLEVIQAMQVNEKAYWSSGGRIVGVLETETKVSDEDFTRIKSEWQSFSRDSQQRYKTAILEQGLKYSPISEGMRGVDTVGIDKNKRDTILAIWGVPAPKLGIMESASFKLEDADKTFWSESMWPRFKRWEDGLQSLVNIFDPDWALRYERVNFEDDVEKLTNAKTMQSLYCYTSNQILAYTGAPEIGENGDVIWVPNNLIPVRIDHIADLADRDEKQAEQALAAAAQQASMNALEGPPVAKPPVAGQGPAKPGEPVAGKPKDGAPGAPADDQGNPKNQPNHKPVAAKPAVTRGRGPVKTPPDVQKALELDAYRRKEAAKIVARNMAQRGLNVQPTAMGHVLLLDQKRIARAGAVLHPPTRASVRAPVIGEAIRKNRNEVTTKLEKRFLPLLRDGFRKQHRSVLAVLRKMKKAETANVMAAIKKNWNKTPVRQVLVAIRMEAGQAGYNMGAKSLPPRHARILRQKFAAMEDEKLQPRARFGVKVDDPDLSDFAGDPELLAESLAVGDATMEDVAAAVNLGELEPTDVFNEALLNPYLEDSDLSAALAQRLSGYGLGDRLDSIDETTLSDLQDTIMEGIRRGYSPLQIADGVDEEDYEGILGVFDDATDWRAESIARSETADAYNWGSVAAYGDAKVTKCEALDGEEWDESCRQRDGRIFDIPEDGLTPVDPETGEEVSTHPNCILSWAPLESEDVDYLADVPETTGEMFGENA